MGRHQVERIRHETRRRTLNVETAVKLTPMGSFVAGPGLAYRTP